MEKETQAQKFYKRYEYLAKVYAKKVFSEERLGLEKSDIAQDLRLKIFTSIEAYSLLYSEWKTAPEKLKERESFLNSIKGKNFPKEKIQSVKNEIRDLKWLIAKGKPVPLEFYLKSAMVNKVKDFMKIISREKVKISMESINFDYGLSNETEIDFKEKKVIVNDIDLLHGLTPDEQRIYLLFLKGFPIPKLSNIHKDIKVSEGREIREGDFVQFTHNDSLVKAKVNSFTKDKFAILIDESGKTYIRRKKSLYVKAKVLTVRDIIEKQKLNLSQYKNDLCQNHETITCFNFEEA